MKPNQLPKRTTQEKAASPWQGQQAAQNSNIQCNHSTFLDTGIADVERRHTKAKALIVGSAYWEVIHIGLAICLIRQIHQGGA